AAAERELARFADEIRPHEAVLNQRLQQRVHVELFVLRKADRAGAEGVESWQLGEKGADGDDQNVCASFGERAQRADLFAHDSQRRTDVLIRRERRRWVRADAVGFRVKETERG